MAASGEDSVPELKDFQIGCSWIPTTPAKPNSTAQQPICRNWQVNNPGQANWVETERYSPPNQVTQANLCESGRLPGDYVQKTQCQTAPACYSPPDLANVSRVSSNWPAGDAANFYFSGDYLSDFDTWQAGQASNSHVYGLRTSDKLFTKDADKCTNMSFASLLALAHEGRQFENVRRHSDSVGTSCSSAPRFHPQIEGSQFTVSYGSSGLHDLDNLLGAKYDANVLTDGSSIPSRPFFDLNSLPRTITDAALSKKTSFQFEPITPEKTNKAEYVQESPMKDLSTNEVTTRKDAKENKITGDGVTEDHEKREKSHMIIDQLCAATSTQLQENHKPDKGGTEETDLSKTPQQKARRRKHRPKVIIEGQNKSTPKSSAKKPSVSQETTKVKRTYVRRKGVTNPLGEETDGTDLNKKDSISTNTPTGKRKYVRRKGINKPEGNMDKETTETTEVNTPRRTRSSCRRSLNFDLDGQVRDESSSYCPPSNCDRQSQAENLNTQYQVREDSLSRPKQNSPNSSPSANMDPLKDNMPGDQIVCTRGKCQIVFSDVTHDKETNTAQVRMNPDGQRTPRSPSDSICSSTYSALERQVRGLKRQNMGTAGESELCNRNEIVNYNPLQACLSIFSQTTPGLHFPTIYKKTRTEKGHNMVKSSSHYTASTSDNHVKLEIQSPRDSCRNMFTSVTNQGSSGAQCQVTSLLTTNRATDGTLNGRKVFESLLALGPTERIRKRRSKGPTRLREIASLLKVCRVPPASTGRAATTSSMKQNIEILHEPPACMEALVADTRSTMTTKKRSKRSMLINSTVQNLYNHQKSATITMGPPLALTWKSASPVDLIIEQLNQLDLNAEGNQSSAEKQNAFMAYHRHYQLQHALVPFQRGGAVIPFDGSFNQVRRRRPRPKVDLDDETTRVWRLLLENINSEGIDGTDEEKTKWWDEERRVFNGRADSFIARMHLVQGDRRFSPWKGSVVDSVVGVFLTQNVSDHLSSSAFMSMAARFPIKSKTQPAELHDEKLDTQKFCELDPDGTFGLNDDVLNESVCGEDTKLLQDFEDDSIREVNSVNTSGNSFGGFFPKDKLGGQSPNTSKHGPVMSRETAANKSISLIEDGRDTEDTLSSQTPQISSQNSVDSPIAQTAERSDSCLLSTSEEEPTAGVKQERFTSSTSFVKLLQMAGTVLHDRQVQSESSALGLQNEGHLDNPVFPAETTESCSKSTLCHLPNSGPQATVSDLSKQNSKSFNSSSDKELCSAEISELSSESASGTTFQKVTAVSFEAGPKFSGPNATTNNSDQIEINQRIVENQTGQVPAQSLFQENYKMQEVLENPLYPQNLMDVTGSSSNIGNPKNSEHKEVNSNKNDPKNHTGKMVGRPKAKEGRTGKEKENKVDWDHLRKQTHAGGRERARTANTMDSVDWDADFLNRLVREHGSIDLEWLRDVPPDKAKEYLLSFRGLGLKSVECVRLLTLHHLAFPVDTNVGRIAVRLGWVPLQPLPESLQLHLLELYPVLESIQKYLWPRLCKLDQRTLARLALPAPEEKSIVSATGNRIPDENPMRSMHTLQLPSPEANQMNVKSGASNSQPIIEEPTTPEPIIEVPATPEPGYTQVPECDIESAFDEDPDEIPTIQLNMEEFTHNLQKIIQQNTELQEGDMSKALVALTSEAASIPVPKLKNVSRLRTEHQVYELPDSHPLLEGLDKREPDDPCPYLLAIWTPGETMNSIEPPERRCSSQGFEKLCTDETCSSCNSIREANSQTVRGTLLIPCRTAMRGSFPLNGTYFQVNEVFSDHESSLSPLDVPRQWLWNLPRRTVYFGTSIPTIFKGLSTEGIQYCFWRGKSGLACLAASSTLFVKNRHENLKALVVMVLSVSEALTGKQEHPAPHRQIALSRKQIGQRERKTDYT
ncbi:hypothetical protein DH2020_026217 [Rehmannia glutinosa]|uniref:HhH-GPD domain-containing protein n=1 Tax=Rehmannia glutinosa TaxID=99300 RepID=A0ABR0VXF0_REHGL